MTPDELQEIKDDLTNITPGPWYADISDGISQDWSLDNPLSVIEITGWTTWSGCNHRLEYKQIDAEFIAKAPERISALVAEVERLQGVLSEILGKYTD